MQKHYPRGSRLRALEKNELKRRALEMVLLLFYTEDLKQFVVSSIHATDLPPPADTATRHLKRGTKKLYKTAWTSLVDAGILSQDESDELEQLIDYRNLIAHQIHNLTADINRVPFMEIVDNKAQYQFNALKRIRYLHNKVSSRMGKHFVLSVSFRGLWFESAERTYIEELQRLGRKIRRQSKLLQCEIDKDNTTISHLRDSGVLERLQPGHPDKVGPNGRLTEEGIKCCRQLFRSGASALVVAYLMRLSLRTTTKQYRAWRAAN